MVIEAKEVKESLVRGQRGLIYEIRCIDENIMIKRRLGESSGFEEEILKSYLAELRRRRPQIYAQISPELKSRRP